MNIDIILIYSTIQVLVNIWVTYLLIIRDDLDGFQKLSQSIIVWLIPVLGALLIWLLNYSSDNVPSPSKEFGGGSNDSGNVSSSPD